MYYRVSISSSFACVQGLQIQGLRAALVGYVRRLVTQPRTSWLLRIASSPPHTGPTLLLLRETLHQVAPRTQPSARSAPTELNPDMHALLGQAVGFVFESLNVSVISSS